MAYPWTADALLDLARSYQPAAIFAAAADLDLFTALREGPLAADALARKQQCGVRGITMLLDALSALQLLRKDRDLYSLSPGLENLLTPDGSKSVLAMAQHQANCLRNWVQLAKVIQSGRPADRRPSVRGEARDCEAFIAAMDNVSAPVATQVIQGVPKLPFQSLLDVGGASGSWTIAFLKACPAASATIFDLPHVLPMAQHRLAAAGLEQRVKLVGGDFLVGPLPPGADLAWVSAIVHQNSREQNRRLFHMVYQALVPGGRIAIRDILMEENRTEPVAGAFFAINMLVATEGGGTFTFAELREDLESAGFIDAAVTHQDEGMNSIVVAKKPS